MSRFRVKNLFFHMTEKLHFSFTTFLLSERLWIRGGGISPFSVKIFVSLSAAKLRKGRLLFHKTFGIEKNDGREGLGQGEYHHFPFSVKSFCLTALKSFVGEPFCA